MSTPPTDLPAALARIDSLEREKRELEKRLDTLGTDIAALRADRGTEGNRYKGRLVVIGFAMVVLAVFGAAVIMYVQLRHEGPPPHVDMPGTPHGTAVPGFPPPPPDPGNSGSNPQH